MKKKIFLTLGIVVGVLVIAIVVLVANLGKIVNSKKDALLAQAEKQIGRDISVGDVGVAIWPEIGVRVRDVSISEDPAWGAEPFVRVADVRVNVALMPLLKRQVEVKRFVLNDPMISVIKGDANRFNFTSMVEAAGGGAGSGTGGGKSGAEAVPFVLAFADIENGTVHYVDKASGLDKTIRDIDFSAQNVRLDAPVSAKLAAAVFGDAQDVHVEATVGPVGQVTGPADLADKPLAATLSLGPVKLSTLAAQKSGAPPMDPSQDGDVDVNATLSGTFGAAVFDEIGVKLAVLGATEPNLEISATAGPFDLLAESTLVFTGARVKGDVKAGALPLSALKMKPAAPGKPLPKLGGEASASVAFEGAATALAFTAHLDATQASYEIEDQFSKPAGIPAVIDAQGTFRPEGVENAGVEFTAIDATVHALRAHGSGKLVPFKDKESMSFSFDATTSLGPWKDMMPAMRAFAPGGDVNARLTISGAPKPGAEPDIKGTATFKNVSATIPNVPNPLKDGAGSASFTAKSARVNETTFSIGKSAFRATADIPSFTPMKATYRVTSDEVWRNDVQAPAPNAPKLPRPEVFRGVAVTGTTTEIPGAKPKPTDPAGAKPVQSDLDITSKSGTVSNIDYTDAVAKIRATPEKVFIDSFSARTMGGTISGSGTMQPLQSSFDITTKVENVNLAEYFRYKSPAMADAFSGRISGDLNLSGAGKTWEELQKTLAGKGSAVVLEGELHNVNLTRQLLASIQGIPLVPADLSSKMAAKHPKVFAENSTAFKNLAGKVTISDGKLQVPDLKLASSDMSLSGNAWFSFAKDMSMNSTLTLSDALTKDLIAEVPAVKYLLTDTGKLDIPLSLSGAVTKPAVSIDMAALSARAQKAMLEEGKQGVNQQLKGLLNNLKKKE